MQEGGHENDHANVLNAITITFTRHIDRLEHALAEAKEKVETLERERDQARTEAAQKVALAGLCCMDEGSWRSSPNPGPG